MPKHPRYFSLEPDMQRRKWSLDEPLDDQGREMENFKILVVTKLLRCIDDKASREILVWKPDPAASTRQEADLLPYRNKS